MMRSKTRWTPAGSMVLVLGAVAVFSVAWATPSADTHKGAEAAQDSREAPSLSVATAITASPSLNITAGALQLDPPAAPSQCKVGKFKVPYFDDGSHLGPGSSFSWYYMLSWKDNSTNEDGFIVELWSKPSGIWVLDWSGTMQANSTVAWLMNDPGPGTKFRVKAFNASGDSAWSNWAN